MNQPTKPKTCPDTCPICWLNLKRDGYPEVHQHSGSGDECAFRWEPPGPLDPDYED